MELYDKNNVQNVLCLFAFRIMTGTWMSPRVTVSITKTDC